LLELPETPPEPVQRKAELLGVPWAARFLASLPVFSAGNREVFKKNRERPLFPKSRLPVSSLLFAFGKII
jgi:hypothetical protein